MSLYQYKAKNRQGKVISGKVNAKTNKEAKLKLVKRGLKAISISTADIDEDLGITPILGTYFFKDSEGKFQINPMSGSPSLKDLTIFTKQLATMISSGIPLVQSIQILAKQQKNLIFRIF